MAEAEVHRRSTAKVAVTKKHLRLSQTRDRKKSRGSVLTNTDALRDKQLKEARESLRSSLDARHQYLFSAIATKLGMQAEDVENLVLDDKKTDLIDEFFGASGPKSLLFFYEEKPQRTTDGKPDKPTKRLYLTDGAHEAFPGLGIYFLRVSNKPITSANIAQELNFGALESSSGNLLEAVESLLKNVYLPALREQSNWGKLSDDASGHSTKEVFLGKLDSFVGVLANAQASIADAARISPCSDPSILAISSPVEAIAAASNPEVVTAAESCALTWCKEIEQILTESEQMRKEADDVGPKAELGHWKKRLAKFDSLTACVKSKECKTVISILVASKSKVLKVWKELDLQITDFTNEAKDNVKFLYTLEKYCEPLYKCNPVTMLDTVP